VFSGFRDQKLEEKIRNLGGSVSDTISKHTFSLIVKDDKLSVKVEKAKKYGIEIILKSSLNI
jgi:NAD-dependent DNA ligase